MIIHRIWAKYRYYKTKKEKFGRTVWVEGWFLFGIIPLYIREKE